MSTMLNGLILIKSSYGGALVIASEAKKVSGVKDAYPVFGRYDVVVFVEAQDFQALKEVAVNVGRMEGVRSTETLPEAS